MAKSSGGTRYFRPVSVQKTASDTIRSIISDLNSPQGFSREQPFKIGGVEERMKKFALANGVELGSNDVYMNVKQIAHTLREAKQESGKAISKDGLISFPEKRYGMQMFYEKENNTFVYYDGENKYVLKPNYRIKLTSGKEKVVNYITASKTDGTEFGLKKYIEIKKK